LRRFSSASSDTAFPKARRGVEDMPIRREDPAFRGSDVSRDALLQISNVVGGPKGPKPLTCGRPAFNAPATGACF
jgi:hypothetical protein